VCHLDPCPASRNRPPARGSEELSKTCGRGVSFQATSVPRELSGSAGVMSISRSRSLPLWNIAPLRTSATSCGALTAR
jgi:hypothetical protein